MEENNNGLCKRSGTSFTKSHCRLRLKLLLRPIVLVYTRTCAANTVEKYERSLVVG